MPPKPSPSRRSTPSSPPSSAKNTYLITYNAISAALWASVLYYTVAIGAHEVNVARKASAFGFGKLSSYGGLQALGSGKVFEGLDGYVRAVQTLAAAEVGHSLVGIVRSPLLTTVMQVASRFGLVWLVAYFFPQSTAHSPAYASMLFAWSVTEVIRYSYFVFNLSGAGVPGVLSWLRYNTFIILYPLGIGSECWLIYSAIPLAAQRSPLFAYALWAILAVYVPGSYILFSHMLSQRRRIGRESRKKTL